MKSIILVLFTILLVSCPQRQQTFSPAVEQAIQLFYLENRNDEVLQLTNKIVNTQNYSFEDLTLIKLMRAAAFCENGLTDSAKQIINNLDSIRIIDNSTLSFWYNSIKGLCYFRSNQLPEAFNILTTAINKSYDDRAKALSLRLIARIHFSSGDANKASEWLAQSSDLFSKLGFDKSVAINNKMIGRYFASKKNVTEAKKFLKIAEQGLLQSYDSIEIFYIYINLLDVSQQLNNIEKAKEYAIKCAKYLGNKSDYQAIAILNNNLGEIDYLLKKYESSRNYYQKTLDLPKDYISSKLRQCFALLGIAKSYTDENNLHAALQYVNDAYTIDEKENFKLLKLNIRKQLAAIYKKMGNHILADKYMQEVVKQLEESENANEKNIETIYNATLNFIKLEAEAKKMKSDRKFFIFLTISGIVFTLLIVFYAVTTLILHRSRNSVLKALVKKNLQIIEDERKMNEVLRDKINSKKAQRKPTDEDKNLQLYNQLTDWLQTDNRFSRKDLSADLVARELGTNRDYLARAISQQNTRFNDLVNKYRIDYAVKILGNKCDKRSKYSLSYISTEAGFKSISVFIEAFRKQTGMNPAQFRATVCAEFKK